MVPSAAGTLTRKRKVSPSTTSTLVTVAPPLRVRSSMPTEAASTPSDRSNVRLLGGVPKRLPSIGLVAMTVGAAFDAPVAPVACSTYSPRAEPFSGRTRMV